MLASVFLSALFAIQMALAAPANSVLTQGWVSVLPAGGAGNQTQSSYYLNNNGVIVPFTRASEGSNSTKPGPTSYTIFTPMQSCSKISFPFDIVYNTSNYIGTVNLNGPVQGTKGRFRELKYASGASDIWVIDCRTLKLTLYAGAMSQPSLCSDGENLTYDNTEGGLCRSAPYSAELTYVVGASPFAE